MDLYIIRHAQSTNNALADERERVFDPLLTDLGYRQAALLAGHLSEGHDLHPVRPWLPAPASNGRGYGITRLFTSAMRRTLLTTQPLGAALGLSPEVWIDIHEEGGVWLDHGAPIGVKSYGGITRSELQERFPGYRPPDDLTEVGWWPGSGRESLSEAALRAGRVASLLRAWGGDPGRAAEKIAIVTHGAFASLLLTALLGVAAHPVSYHLDNTSISLVRFRRETEVSVRYLNRLDHLSPDLIT